MSGAPLLAPDPLADTLAKRQPDARFDAYLADIIAEQAKDAGLRA
jgi:hypothetical protein